MIYRAPEVVPLAIDLHEDLAEVPPPAARFHPLDPPFADLRGKHGPEHVPPVTDSFVADIDAALVQQILDIPQ